MITGDQDPERAVVPIESMRPVAAGRTQPQHSKVLRIDLGHGLDAQRGDPERLRLRNEGNAVDAPAPDQLVNLHGLTGLDVRLNDLAIRLVRRSRSPPSAHAAVGTEPEIAGADGQAARVV